MLFVISGSINNRVVRDFAESISTLNDKEDVQILINSRGGKEFCGRALAGMIKNLKDHGHIVNTIGHGDIFSTAVIVFAAGSRRSLSTFAHIMVHESQLDLTGGTTYIKKAAIQFEEDERFWCTILSELTGTSTSIWVSLHEKETYLLPEEALKLNLATELI